MPAAKSGLAARRIDNVNLNVAIAGLITLRRNPTARAMVGVFALRAVITLLSLALVVLASRALGPHDFGTYSILFSAAGLFSVVATFGQELFLMRCWSEYSSTSQQAHLKGAMLFSLGASIGGVTLVAIPFYVWFSMTHDTAIALTITIYLAVLALMLTTTHLTRSAIGVTAGDGYSNLLLIGPGILYILGCLVLGVATDIRTIFIAMTVGAAVTVVIHLAMVRRKTLDQFPDFARTAPAFETRNWFARSLKLWISIGLEAANQYADVVIIGFLMNPTVAGGYFVTTRIANAFAMATGAIHLFSTKQFPTLYYRNEHRQLSDMLDSVAIVTLAVVIGGMVIILAGGHWLLQAFNPEYVSYYGALALLSFGTAAIAAAGPSGSILMLTGHEGRYLSIIGSAVLMRSVGFFVLIPFFGIVGAVTATAISFVWMALMLRGSARKAIGIDGSVLRLLGRFRGRPLSSPAE